MKTVYSPNDLKLLRHECQVDSSFIPSFLRQCPCGKWANHPQPSVEHSNTRNATQGFHESALKMQELPPGSVIVEIKPGMDVPEIAIPVTLFGAQPHTSGKARRKPSEATLYTHVPSNEMNNRDFNAYTGSKFRYAPLFEAYMNKNPILDHETPLPLENLADSNQLDSAEAATESSSDSCSIQIRLHDEDCS